MNVLVTGGAGFIGSHFIRHLLHKQQGDMVVNLDALTYAADMRNLADIEENYHYQFIQGNIENRELVYHLMRTYEIDVIVNFAAETHVDRSITQPDVFIGTNVLGTQVLLDAALHFGASRFVQISTDEVYGSLGEAGYFTETSPLAPSSPYSSSKAGADLLVLAYHRTFGLPVNITRCSNNYGPHQHPEKLIPRMITRAMQNKRLPVYGKGENVRDWLHVKDHAEAVLRVLQQGKSGEVYNIGGHNEWNNLSLVKLLLELLGKDEQLVEYVQDRPGHDLRYAIDASKIQQELDWKPTRSFQEGLIETIEWYMERYAKLDVGERTQIAQVLQ
ncbi:dTDP-glucose 4,6-dehydratase [Marinicrinis sediminis]|uniref:dTDP-glucose 4,6-dehydratase n=1 Tax=Marinicrinis sediminis TaxID=1652465 RepID=A0ABW5RCC2_9BACL